MMMTDDHEQKIQAGTVLIFKEGVSKEEAQKRLEALRDILDYLPRVNEFNPEWGGPVWYIP
jgi:Asp-tRNA(Asn)/Glu-tRNA(Gln) amidotransferase C subunit